MSRIQVDWHGSFAVIVTPFKCDGEIDELGYREVVDQVIEAGCHGVIAAGSTGEFAHMTHEERKRVFGLAVDQVKGRVPVLGGSSATQPEDVIDLTRHASEVGCSGVMVLPPIYTWVDDRELIEFYRRVSGEGGLPLMLYNSPLAVHENLTPFVVERLMELDNVVAIKDSSRDMQQLDGLIRYCSDLRIFVGLEDLLLPGIAVGAVGAVAMVPQIVGRMAVELYEKAASGDMASAQVLHHKMVRIYDLFKVGSGYVAIKESMNMLGKAGGYPRPPLLPFTDDQRARLREIYQDVGLLAPSSNS